MLKDFGNNAFFIMKDNHAIGRIEYEHGLDKKDILGATILDSFSNKGLQKAQKMNLDKVVYLKMITLDKEFRREGFGRQALLDMILVQKERGTEWLFLIPYLIDEDWAEIDAYSYMEHLTNLYTSVGFEVFDISDKKDDYGFPIKFYAIDIRR